MALTVLSAKQTINRKEAWSPGAAFQNVWDSMKGLGYNKNIPAAELVKGLRTAVETFRQQVQTTYNQNVPPAVNLLKQLSGQLSQMPNIPLPGQLSVAIQQLTSQLNKAVQEESKDLAVFNQIATQSQQIFNQVQQVMGNPAAAKPNVANPANAAPATGTAPAAGAQTNEPRVKLSPQDIQSLRRNNQGATGLAPAAASSKAFFKKL